tara:strand:- start:7 stop:339 length:333 start_codon:yes stop_codon:yes gene_type:complete
MELCVNVPAKENHATAMQTLQKHLKVLMINLDVQVMVPAPKIRTRATVMITIIGTVKRVFRVKKARIEQNMTSSALKNVLIICSVKLHSSEKNWSVKYVKMLIDIDTPLG